MKENTNLEAVKFLAHALLQFDIEQTTYAPIVVKHPFTDSGIAAIYGADGALTISNLLEKPAELALWRKQIGEQIDQAENAVQIYAMITKSYAFGFLKYAKEYLSDKDLGTITADAWINTESPGNDPNFGQKGLCKLFRSIEPSLLMDNEEYESFLALEDPVTIYRGVTSKNAQNINGMSWTLDRKTAEWFSQRFGDEGCVYEAQIPKQYVYALFNGRGESEVVVNPRHLTEITQVQAMEYQTMGGLS